MLDVHKRGAGTTQKKRLPPKQSRLVLEPLEQRNMALVHGIDLGTGKVVASVLSGPVFGQPVLVRNNISADSTPLAVLIMR